MVEIDGEKRYTVPNDPPKKTEKKEKHVFVPPTLGENPTFGRRIRVAMYIFVGSSLFEGFITLCIFLNTTVMSLEYYKMPTTFKDVLEIFNHVSNHDTFALKCDLYGRNKRSR